MWLYGMRGTASRGYIPMAPNVYDVGTLNNHALCTRVIRVDGYRYEHQNARQRAYAVW